MYACPGQEIVLTCLTSGSPIVAWINDDYIGPQSNGNQLELASSDSVGTRVMSMINLNTFAELTMKEGGLVTESQLHIVVSADIPSTTVRCTNVATGSFSSVYFELLCK